MNCTWLAINVKSSKAPHQIQSEYNKMSSKVLHNYFNFTHMQTFFTRILVQFPLYAFNKITHIKAHIAKTNEALLNNYN